jgi:hypothetical protein
MLGSVGHLGQLSIVGYLDLALESGVGVRAPHLVQRNLHGQDQLPVSGEV